MTPYWVENIQPPHTIVAVSAGIAQARSMPIESRRRKNVLRRIIMSATSVPSTIVTTTQHAANTTVRRSTPP